MSVKNLRDADGIDFVINLNFYYSFFSIPLNSFCIYVIAFKSNKEMMLYRKYLLLNAFWSFLMDLWFGDLMNIIVLFPSTSGVAYGLLGGHVDTTILLGVGSFLGTQVVFSCGATLLFRYKIIMDMAPSEYAFIKLSDARFIASLVLVWLFLLPPSVLMLSCYQPFDEVRERISLMYPEYRDYFLDPHITGIYRPERRVFDMMVAYTGLVCLISPVVGFFWMFLIYRTLYQMESSTTMKNRRHTKLTIAMSLQITAPFCIIACPSLTMYVSFGFEIHFPLWFGGLVYFAYSLHGTTSSILCLILYKPYSQFCLKLLRLDKKSSTVVTVASHASSSTNTTNRISSQN